MNMEGSSDRNVVIRRGSQADVDALIQMCQLGFPQNVCWQGLRSLAKRWWEVTLVSSEAETWILQIDNEVLALCVLVFDEVRWAQKKPQRCGPAIMRYVSAMSCPIVAGSKIIRDINDRIHLGQRQTLALINWKPETRTWLELITVYPQQRGRGFAIRLLRHCEVRTRALGREAIGLRVRRANKPACCLYDIMGYQQASATAVDFTYAKVVV